MHELLCLWIRQIRFIILIKPHLYQQRISLTPHRIEETHFSDQGFLKGVGNITNDQTYKDNYLSDKLVQSTGNGTLKTSDGQSITWISSDMGRPIDGRWVYHGIMLFNNTQSKSLSFLNSSVGLSKSVLGNGTDRIWIL